ncbi:Carboxylesterase [Paragonimus heterotremus]|uniref:Carboxylic ester hydrolase n=1 Tax=Paragonimus heterotremus TaxID=100268 RepID=A0A8J4WHC1_9TREM|nr:Carboxylesterase [Paragonimus heterotremus]
MYPGHLLASMGLVVVTFNYRLGPFGFLSTGDSASIGNYGLWDQLFALRWVKENIEWFRGDPSQITLMGESAGGASVGLLTVSPRSRDQDLFHRAIIMSGSDLSPWAMSDPNAINTGHYAIELGRRLGCSATSGLALSLSQVSALGESWKPVPIRPGEFGHSSVSLRRSVPYYTQVDTDALIDCLRHSYTAQEIVDVSKSLDPFRGATSFIWTPVVDGPTGFLPRMPLEERKLGHFSKIPLLAGLVHDESSFPFMGKLEEYEGRNLSISEFTDVVARRTIGNFLNGENAYRFNVTAEELYTRYTWWPNLANNSARWERMVAMLSDHDVNAPLESIVRFHAAYSPSVYLYEFAYVSPKDPDAFAGVYHGSEQVFLLGCPFMSESFWTRVFDRQLTPAHAHRTFVHPYDHKISSFVMNLWTNFIKYGNPTPKAVDNVIWRPYKPSEEGYLFIYLNSGMRYKFRPLHMAFWRERFYKLAELVPREFVFIDSLSGSPARSYMRTMKFGLSTAVFLTVSVVIIFFNALVFSLAVCYLRTHFCYLSQMELI